MLFRTIGISLTCLGDHEKENDFFQKLIYDPAIREVNRNFHILYYTTESYKLGDDVNLNSEEVCSSQNIRRLYDYLYHSVKKKKRGDAQGINIITLLNLVVYDHYNNKFPDLKDFNPKGFGNLLESLKEDASITNQIIKNYILNVSRYIQERNVYAVTLEKIYQLKRITRAGWSAQYREIDKKERPESVADHTWACCQLAHTFLTDRFEDCSFMSQDESAKNRRNYNKEHIIMLLSIHDFAEIYIGDIPSGDKTQIEIQQESQFIQSLGVLDSFPHFQSFRKIAELWNEYSEAKTFNAMIAFDIDKLEPLVQFFIYRRLLPSQYVQQEKSRWMQDVNSKLKTEFGRQMFAFIERYLLDSEFNR